MTNRNTNTEQNYFSILAYGLLKFRYQGNTIIWAMFYIINHTMQSMLLGQPVQHHWL